MNYFILFMAALALAACGAPESPLQQPAKLAQQPSASAPAARAAALPDFTALMQKQGPAGVNVLTRVARPAAGGAAPPPPRGPPAAIFRPLLPDQPPPRPPPS